MAYNSVHLSHLILKFMYPSSTPPKIVSHSALRFSVSLREAPYRKILVTHYFFKKIQYLSTNDVFNHVALMSIVSSYLDFKTESVEAQS